MSAVQEWWRPRTVVPARTGAVSRVPEVAAASPVAFWALVVFTAVMLLAPQVHFPILRPLRIALLPGLVAIGAYVLDCVSRRRPAAFSREIRLALLLAFWAIALVPLSLWPGGSVEVLEGLYLKALVVFWLLAGVMTTLRRFRVMAWALSLMSVVLALAGVKNYLAGAYLESGAPIDRIQGYEAALTSNPNDLALMLNLVLPLTAALLLGERRSGRRVVLLAIMGLSVIGIVATFSRGGFITLAAIGLMYLWKLRRRPERRWIWGAAVIALACLPALPGAYLGRITSMTDIDADETGSSEARWRDVKASAGYILRHPIVGAGIGSDVIALNDERGSTWRSVHNAYLQYGVDLGLPGLALFVALLHGCLRRVKQTEREAIAAGGPRDLLNFAQAMQVSLVAFAVAAMVHPVAYNFYFYYFGGLALGLSAVGGPRSRES